MVTASQHLDDVPGNDRARIGGLALLAPSMGLGWVGHVLGGLPLLVTLAGVGAILGLACRRQLTRLLQAEAGLIALLAAVSMLA
jgi:hypothetical protein